MPDDMHPSELRAAVAAGDVERLLGLLTPAEMTALDNVSRGRIRVDTYPGVAPLGNRTADPSGFRWAGVPAGYISPGNQAVLHGLADAGLITDGPGPDGVRVTDPARGVLLAANSAVPDPNTEHDPDPRTTDWEELRAAADGLLARAGSLLANWPTTREHGTRDERDSARVAYRHIHHARQALGSAETRGDTRRG